MVSKCCNTMAIVDDGGVYDGPLKWFCTNCGQHCEVERAVKEKKEADRG